MSLEEAKSKGQQFLAALHPTDLEEPLAAAAEEVASIACSLGTWRVKLIGTWPI